VKILVVDDSPIDRRLAAGLLAKGGFETVLAENGFAALAAMDRDRPDLVVTDLAMPEMDGLFLVEAIRARHPDVPVILMTAQGSEDIAVRALQRGAASFVPKKELARALAATALSILSIRRADGGPTSSHRGPAPARWEIGSDPAEIAPVVGSLESRLARSGLCDETGRIQVSVALREALANAILHGNLGLSSALKEDDAVAHDTLVRERRKESPYRERRVRVDVSETDDEMTFVVSDDGPGFDPSTLPDPTDPANLERTTGRGLFLIRTFMDDVTHTDGGRTITMRKHRRS
jgi:CheY-like chemotaxis protein